MNILIIEDEIDAADELERLIHQIRHNDVICAKLQSIRESVEWLESNPAPDLIFASIQLKDGTSFDIFKNTRIAPVIFFTTQNKFALEAFENNGIDYLLKPIEKKKLQNSFQKLEQLQAFFLSDSPEYVRKFNRLLITRSVAKYKTSLLSYFREQITPVPVSDICFIYTENKFVYVWSKNRKYEIKETLDNLATQLDPHDFFRANRQYIIHRQSIANIEYLYRKKLVVRLIGTVAFNIIISKEKTPNFLNWLEGM